ncbi:MAG: hypothetical protein ACOYXT_30035 [Bacteroidota bacterium]
MKKITILSLAAIAIIVMLYAGVDGLLRDYAYAPMLTFIAACSAVGLSIDIAIHVKEIIRRNNIRKLRPF